MKRSELGFRARHTGIFFVLLLVLLGCGNQKEIIYPVSSSWDGGFLLKFRNYTFGKLPQTNKIDPLFYDNQLNERIQKELRFQFEIINVNYTESQFDSYLYYYFLNDSLSLPYLPYQTGTLSPEQYGISVDTLRSNESVFVLDMVDSGTLQLVWRTFGKVQIRPTDSLYAKMPKLIEAMIKKFPG